MRFVQSQIQRWRCVSDPGHQSRENARSGGLAAGRPPYHFRAERPRRRLVESRHRLNHDHGSIIVASRKVPVQHRRRQARVLRGKPWISFEAGTGGKAVGVHYQHTISWPDIREFLDAGNLHSRCPIGGDEMLRLAGAGVNLRRYIADTGEIQSATNGIDASNRDRSAAGAAEPLMNALQQHLWGEGCMLPQDADGVNGSSLSLKAMPKTV